MERKTEVAGKGVSARAPDTQVSILTPTKPVSVQRHRYHQLGSIKRDRGAVIRKSQEACRVG